MTSKREEEFFLKLHELSRHPATRSIYEELRVLADNAFKEVREKLRIRQETRSATTRKKLHDYLNQLREGNVKEQGPFVNKVIEQIQYLVNEVIESQVQEEGPIRVNAKENLFEFLHNLKRGPHITTATDGGPAALISNKVIEQIKWLADQAIHEASRPEEKLPEWISQRIEQEVDKAMKNLRAEKKDTRKYFAPPQQFVGTNGDPIAHAVKVITAELKKDASYFYAWQSNIAMPILDAIHRSGFSFHPAQHERLHKAVNSGAQDFLHLLMRPLKEEKPTEPLMEDLYSDRHIAHFEFSGTENLIDALFNAMEKTLNKSQQGSGKLGFCQLIPDLTDHAGNVLPEMRDTVVSITPDSVKRGSQNDKEQALKYLMVGRTYTVRSAWKRKDGNIGFYLREVPGQLFNAVVFENLGKVPRTDTMDMNSNKETLNEADPGPIKAKGYSTHTTQSGEVLEGIKQEGINLVQVDSDDYQYSFNLSRELGIPDTALVDRYEELVPRGQSLPVQVNMAVHLARKHRTANSYYLSNMSDDLILILWTSFGKSVEDLYRLGWPFKKRTTGAERAEGAKEPKQEPGNVKGDKF